MFEPQDHPNVIPYPGAPPTRPYDNAGWTLAFQMGVQFDRILEAFTGPFEKVTDWNVKPPAGTAPTAGALVTFDRGVNDSVIAVNRLLAAGKKVGANQSRTSSRHDRRGDAPRGAHDARHLVQRRRLTSDSPPALRGAAHRPLGPVRRVDRVGLDALDPRAVRVPVHARLRARAGRRQPPREVRRAGLRPGRDSRGRRRRGPGRSRRPRRRRRPGRTRTFPPSIAHSSDA